MKYDVDDKKSIISACEETFRYQGSFRFWSQQCNASIAGPCFFRSSSLGTEGYAAQAPQHFLNFLPLAQVHSLFRLRLVQ